MPRCPLAQPSPGTTLDGVTGQTTFASAPAPPAVAATLVEPGAVRHAVPAYGGAVMGTGVVGVAAHTLPVRFPGLGVLATASWLAASALLVLVVAALVLQAARHPEVARAHLLDRRTVPATGTMAMAGMTVGTATLLVGGHLLGRAAVVVDVAVQVPAGLLGLATAVGVPLLLATGRPSDGPGDAAAVWLLPVVPPMVSAAAGALLAPHLGAARAGVLVLCLALFGLSLLAALLMLTLVWARLLLHGGEPAAAAPSVWVVLGPLGQGATALGAIAVAAPGAFPPPYPAGLAVLALTGGSALLGFATFWAALAAAVTVRAHRQGLPFTLGWWSLTFPIGTCVTGLSSLAARTDLVTLRWGGRGVRWAARRLVRRRRTFRARAAGRRHPQPARPATGPDAGLTPVQSPPPPPPRRHRCLRAAGSAGRDQRAVGVDSPGV